MRWPPSSLQLSMSPDPALHRAPQRRTITTAPLDLIEGTGEFRAITGSLRTLPSTVTRLTRAGSPSWLAARARNAWRRPVLLVAVGGLVMLAAILILVLIPLGLERVVAQRVARIPADRDTMPLVQQRQQAQRELAVADSALAAARTRSVQTTLVPSDLSALASLDTVDFLAGVNNTGDSVVTTDSTRVDRSVRQLALRLLIDRARSAPLSVSFRALAESPEIAGNPQIRQLIDSLNTLDDIREAGELAGGADPAFVAVTSQINAIGRRIIRIAESRLWTRVAPVGVDTMTPKLQRDSVAERLMQRQQALGAVRQRNARLRAERDEARRSVNVAVPPAAMLAAGVVLALVAAYGAALWAELRRPVVGELGEVARLAATRVIRYDGTREGARQLRTRRASDRQLPPIIDLASDSFRLLHLAVSPTGDASTRLVITGDEPSVVAAAAVNLAAIAASDARRVLLLDADPYARLLGPALQLPPAAGLDLVTRGLADLREVVRPVRLGRAHAFDVIVAGDAVPTVAAVQHTASVDEMIGRYDLTIACAGAEDARAPSALVDELTDAVVCVRVGATRLGRLARQLGLLRARGVRVRAVLVWATDPPPLLAARVVAPGKAA
jgi:Mrp family chromosome partitioning ATPase